MTLEYKFNERLSNERHLWVIGCSVTSGVGVSEKERFGDIISSRLNLPVITLAKPGASIEWAADQILTSDINKDDIVIWGLTGATRYPFATQNQLLNITPSNYAKQSEVKLHISEKYFLSYDIIHRAKRSILQVENFTNKIGAKLLIGFLPVNGPETDLIMYNYVKTIKSVVLLYNIHSDEKIFIWTKAPTICIQAP